VKNFLLSIVVVLCGFSLAASYHYHNEDIPAKLLSIVNIFPKHPVEKSVIPIDEGILNTFFKKYPDLKIYQLRNTSVRLW
jgi:hypothetical protein